MVSTRFCEIYFILQVLLYTFKFVDSTTTLICSVSNTQYVYCSFYIALTCAAMHAPYPTEVRLWNPAHNATGSGGFNSAWLTSTTTKSRDLEPPAPEHCGKGQRIREKTWFPENMKSYSTIFKSTTCTFKFDTRSAFHWNS